MNRKKIGLLAVAFVLAVGAMEVLALELGSPDFRIPSAPAEPAIAERQ